MKKTTNINNNEVLYEIILCQGKGEITPKMTKLVMEICDGLYANKMYNNMTDDMKNGGKSLTYIYFAKGYGKFDIRKSTNAFAWITQIAKNALIQSYNWDVFGVGSQTGSDRKIYFIGDINAWLDFNLNERYISKHNQHRDCDDE